MGDTPGCALGVSPMVECHGIEPWITPAAKAEVAIPARCTTWLLTPGGRRPACRARRLPGAGWDGCPRPACKGWEARWLLAFRGYSVADAGVPRTQHGCSSQRSSPATRLTSALHPSPVRPWGGHLGNPRHVGRYPQAVLRVVAPLPSFSRRRRLEITVAADRYVVNRFPQKLPARDRLSP